MSYPHTANAYDIYYRLGLYRQRYPQANYRVLKTILHTIQMLQGQPETTVLDFGCGHGRYCLPILESTQPPDDTQRADFVSGRVAVYGYDISPVALSQAATYLKDHTERITFFNHLETLEQHVAANRTPDIGLLLFGVLSHQKTGEERRTLLKWFHQHLQPEGVLILSVPNKWRRFFKTQWKQRHRLPPGDIRYERSRAGEKIALSYHLYTPGELTEELHQCGFSIESLSAESLLPESAVIRSQGIAVLDHQLCRHVPPGWGYGLLVVARKKA